MCLGLLLFPLKAHHNLDLSDLIYRVLNKNKLTSGRGLIRLRFDLPHLQLR